MILTEAQAKTKRCQEGFSQPLADSDHGGTIAQATAGNAFAVIASPIHCIGSGCMAWRWNGLSEVEGQVVVKSPARGYCGKAGKP